MLLLETRIRGGPSSVLGNRHVKQAESKMQYFDGNNFFDWSVSHCLPTEDFLEIEFTNGNNEKKLLKTISRTPNKKNVDTY